MGLIQKVLPILLYNFGQRGLVIGQAPHGSFENSWNADYEYY